MSDRLIGLVFWWVGGSALVVAALNLNAAVLV